MTFSDDIVLEFLEAYGLALTPRAIEYNLRTREGKDVSYSTVNRRLSKMEQAGLIVKEYEEGGYYSITEKGRDYLNGGLDEEDLPDPDEE